jgi:hypothetical protein
MFEDNCQPTLTAYAAPSPRLATTELLAVRVVEEHSIDQRTSLSPKHDARSTICNDVRGPDKSAW